MHWQRLAATSLPPLTFPGEWTNSQLAVRFAIMFSAGALLYQWKDVIPARWSLVAVSVVIVLASSLLPDYRVVGGLPLAYAVIVSGSLIHNKRWSLRTDLSYGILHIRIPDSAIAGRLWACRSESLGVLRHCDHRHAAARRAELVPGREARTVVQIPAQAEVVCSRALRSLPNLTPPG